MSFSPPQDMVDKLIEIWQTVGQGALSDRRWKKTLKLAMAYSLLCGETPAPRHLGVARWTLWTEPDEETDIRNTVLGLTDPVAGTYSTAKRCWPTSKPRRATLRQAQGMASPA